ncbi:MAG: GNAT family protein [Betaproteobacteria bacterium]
MIRGPVVSLRPFRHDEVEAFIALANDSATRGDFMPTRLIEPQKMRNDFAEHGFMSERFTRLAIVDVNDSLVGTIFHFLTRPYSTGREIGLRIFDPAARGLGYGTAALQLLVDNLFANHPINRLEWSCDVRNRASAAVAVKCGFAPEGVVRGLVFQMGAYHDAEVYGLVRADWMAARTGGRP